ncbi:hypothetical protein LIER_38286 [Lithospermum erythrorhizon]|uniref:ATP-dependent DNA helicase n=1 Tax=Lithospermum erythrorhizon TaxID=34254 RepID=A0AAV3PXK9_LITER
MSGELFGKVAAVVHVVEFQKRGLPHAHFLIILKPAYKYLSAEAYDRIVCAELPDKIEDPYLYSLVVKHMMHGPCGSLNSNNVCMVNGKCKNHYPKEFAECTTHGKGTYPAYRRRNNGRTAKVRGHILDNRWVIPYNLTLLAEFNCHINIELCCDIKAVKYLYKYIHKGHDKVLFKVGSDSEVSTVNEIADFQNARWVSPVEATWRIFGFPLYGMYPAVIQLQVHMPNFHCIQFEDDTDLEDLLHNERLQRTMLTEFFTTNAVDSEAKRLNLLYKQFPMYYVWDSQIRTWTRRKKGKVIGRLCTVNPIEGERYYLRLLLNNVHAPTSYDFLLLVDGVQCETFQKAAYLRGLLQQDGDIDKTIEEASVYRMPSELRRLFATLLHYCKPTDPQKLFTTYYEFMAEDFIRVQSQLHLSNEEVLQKVLQGINDTLESLGRNVNQFHLVPFEYITTEFERLTREISAERSIPVPEEDLLAIHRLNIEQKAAFDLIYDAALSGKGGVYFVDGPGGTGKCFLYKVLLAHIRSKGYIGLIVASSGIAATNFWEAEQHTQDLKYRLTEGQM